VGLKSGDRAGRTLNLEAVSKLGLSG
jgi:hypothetical protein